MIASLADFHFLRPAWLLLVPLAIAVFWLWRRNADPLRGWRSQIAPELLAALVHGHDGGAGRGLLAAVGASGGVLVGWLLAALIVAGPTWQLEPSPFADDATPLMIVLKADASMDDPAANPTLLERAQLKIRDIAEARPGQPLGLVAYAGSAHLVLPPTRDTDIVADMAQEIRPDVLPVAGDRLDLALRLAERVLADGGEGGSIVVLADLIDIDPAALQAVAKQRRVPVQFLALAAADSASAAALRDGAQLLQASVEPFDVGGSDVAAIVSRAASAPRAVAVDGADARWQESGYWLVPMLLLLVLLSFRRETRQEAAA